jgi:hypothetical protein
MFRDLQERGWIGSLVGELTTTLVVTLVVAIVLALLTALLADLGHVFAVLAHGLAALATCFACFLRSEFMRVARLVRGATALRGDLTLLVFVHASEATIGLVVAVYHFVLLA